MKIRQKLLNDAILSIHLKEFSQLCSDNVLSKILGEDPKEMSYIRLDTYALYRTIRILSSIRLILLIGIRIVEGDTIISILYLLRLSFVMQA